MQLKPPHRRHVGCVLPESLKVGFQNHIAGEGGREGEQTPFQLLLLCISSEVTLPTWVSLTPALTTRPGLNPKPHRMTAEWTKGWQHSVEGRDNGLKGWEEGRYLQAERLRSNKETSCKPSGARQMGWPWPNRSDFWRWVSNGYSQKQNGESPAELGPHEMLWDACLAAPVQLRVCFAAWRLAGFKRRAFPFQQNQEQEGQVVPPCP